MSGDGQVGSYRSAISLLNSATHQIDSEKFIFFYNDLTAAFWVLNIDDSLEDSVLIERFMEIHNAFLSRLNRKDKGIFSKVTCEKLADVIRGWTTLYRATLELLRQQFPRLSTKRDLLIGRINWSERLNICASGLLLIDHASRYAEYWAERAIKTSGGYSSLGFRLRFIGSVVFNEYAEAVRRGELLVLDGFSNGVTSYDMMVFLKESCCEQELFLAEIKKLGWRLEIGDDRSIERIYQIYSKLDDTVLHI